MFSTRNRALILLPFVILAALTIARPASAQCGLMGEQFQSISQETGNSFVAEYSTNRTLNIRRIAPPPLHAGLKSVARDSQGRVRVVRSLGNYSVKSTDGVVTQVERLGVSICDPTTGVLAVLDTADKTATIFPRQTPLRTMNPQPSQEQSFCTHMFAKYRDFPRVTIEDLGQQTIAGYEAIGIRIYYPPPLATGTASPSSYNELWCSDALGAIVQQTSESKSQKGTETRTESTMQNIERREPEISFFQIPYDYTILERATDGSHSAGRRSTPAAPADSARPR